MGLVSCTREEKEEKEATASQNNWRPLMSQKLIKAEFTVIWYNFWWQKPS